MSKVFCVGLHKTGLTTMRECVRVLGYNVCPQAPAYAILGSVAAGDTEICRSPIERYDAFVDSPWNFRGLYKVWDEMAPGSLFILTSRPFEQYFASLIRWVCLQANAREISYRETLGILPIPDNRDAVQAACEAHATEIMDYFASKYPIESKLAVLDWTRHGWAELCGFLGLAVPDVPFPHKLRFDPMTGNYLDP